MKVRVLMDIENLSGWTPEQAKWLVDHHNKVVEGKLTDDDHFRPNDSPVALYADEYELIEKGTEEWICMSLQDNGTVIYLRCAEGRDAEAVPPKEAFYLLLCNARCEIILNDPKDDDYHYKANFRFERA